MSKSLRIVQWASPHINDRFSTLTVSADRKPVSVAKSPATGEPLVSNGKLGADLIRLAAGESFAPHTHPGDHLLIVVAGRGTISFDGVIYPTRAGQIYMVEGDVPHAVGAVTDHVILAAGAPHHAIDSETRMELVGYEELLADHAMSCLLCGLTAVQPNTLESLGCPH
jgi:quercetin dioxygenase-like cupin family protein